MQEKIITEENIEVKKEGKKNKKKWFVVISLVLLLLFGAYSFLKNSNKELEDGSTVSTYIVGDGFSPGLSAEELREMMQKKIDESKVAFSIYTRPIFKGKKGTIMLGNPKHNLYDIDLEVKIGNRTIIKTDKIAPDKYISEIEIIGKSLEKGEHKADGRIKGYNRKTGELVGEIAIDMILTVK